MCRHDVRMADGRCAFCGRTDDGYEDTTMGETYPDREEEDMDEQRAYMIATFDVTDLAPEDAGRLEMAVYVQSENDDEFPGSPAPEIHYSTTPERLTPLDLSVITAALDVAYEMDPEEVRDTTGFDPEAVQGTRDRIARLYDSARLQEALGNEEIVAEDRLQVDQSLSDYVNERAPMPNTERPTVYLVIGSSAIAFEEAGGGNGEILETVDWNDDNTPDWTNACICDARGAGGQEGFDLLAQALMAAEMNAEMVGWNPVNRVPKGS